MVAVTTRDMKRQFHSEGLQESFPIWSEIFSHCEFRNSMLKDTSRMRRAIRYDDLHEFSSRYNIFEKRELTFDQAKLSVDAMAASLVLMW